LNGFEYGLDVIKDRDGRVFACKVQAQEKDHVNECGDEFLVFEWIVIHIAVFSFSLDLVSPFMAIGSSEPRGSEVANACVRKDCASRKLAWQIPAGRKCRGSACGVGL
jgi:hypothetical protein